MWTPAPLTLSHLRDSSRILEGGRACLPFEQWVWLLKFKGVCIFKKFILIHIFHYCLMHIHSNSPGPGELGTGCACNSETGHIWQHSTYYPSVGGFLVQHAPYLHMLYKREHHLCTHTQATKIYSHIFTSQCCNARLLSESCIILVTAALKDGMDWCP